MGDSVILGLDPWNHERGKRKQFSCNASERVS